MNYAEWHLGDYAEATAHLSLIEDGAYSRMLRKYYATEQPLPGEKREIYRLISARSKDEREAVDAVLADFFTLEPDGKYHQARADAEIAKYHAKQGDREAKRENERERQHRARERRKALFDQLRERGIVPDFDATTAQLEAELSRVTTGDRHAEVTPPVTRTDTANTRHQTPDTRHQSPVNKTSLGETPSNPSNRDGAPPSPGEVCKAMRDAGISKVNPANPRLHRLIADGATLAEFVDAVPGSLSAQSPFGYALGTVEGRRKEATTRANGGGSARDIDRADTLHTLTGGLISDRATKNRKDATHGRTIDGEAKRVD